MFIELTDHLRCPADHDEQFLVLLPDRMEGRSVRTGQLGCPVCGRVFRLADGVFDAGDAPQPPPHATSLTADALGALVGLHGPGGYLVLAGAPAALGREVTAGIPGVALVAANPPADVEDSDLLSVLRANTLPLKSRSMRGVVLGAPFGGDPRWVAEAARVVLPGLRVVGEGPDPVGSEVELLASAGGVWVGTPRR
ncbi:MAG TPA: hypothetical protein VIG08_13725 [Gemmatimonadales bacterium]|jgi:uncharacterized protein YbaR (Trm112 family)